jgi:DNA polymerase-3 subunit delta
MAEGAKPALLAAYLFLGTDELKRATLLKRLMGRLESVFDPSLATEAFDASAVRNPDDFLDACNTLPLVSDMRLVTLRDADKSPKPLVDAIVSYLASPCPTTVLVMTADELPKNSRILTALERLDPKTVIDCAEKRKAELPSLVVNMARTKGLGMTTRAAEALIALIGTSTVALDTELEKLAAFARANNKGAITDGDVNSLVSRAAATSPFELVDAWAAGRTADALTLLGRLTQESPQGLLALCVMRLRELISVRACLDRGVHRPAEVAHAINKQEWQVRRLIDAASKHSAARLSDCLVAAADVDRRMKSGYDPDLELSVFLASSLSR